MMTVRFFDEFDNLVYRCSVAAECEDEALRLAAAKYKQTPKAESMPLCDVAAIAVYRKK